MEKITVAKTASRGIAVAPVYYYSHPDLTARTGSIGESEAEAESAKFIDAQNAVIEELSVLAEKNEIFAAHQEIAGDFMLREGVLTKIKSELKNVQQALDETVEEIAAIFAGMDDEYMKERAADVRDVGKRLMAALKGVHLADLGNMSDGRIIVARDLYPSDTVKMNAEYVRGIITEEGGVTSHVSIIAKSMNIPILVGVKGILSKAEDGVTVCMDAKKGTIVIAPEDAVKEEFLKMQEEYENERKLLVQLRSTEPVTREGKRVYLCANVGNVEDIRHALPMNIDGIGLFRSELLYMENNHFPTEEEQFAVYSQAARLVPQELTIRTLDIGGDKRLPYFEFDEEENPFLGWRAIRISLDMIELFKEQLRAILRAGAFGHVRILLPMIISMTELQRAKELIEECKAELRERGVDFDEHMEIGMMIETPASVVLAADFAKEVDFFSIGTNDLTQYLLAVDRGNKKIAQLYDFMHPAVLRAIQYVIAAGHKEHIKVGMCGEMAGTAEAIPVLLEMGLDEFSMSAGSIDYARKLILEN